MELPAIPEGVQEKGRCCIERRGLVGTVVMGQWLDSVILVLFSNLTVSVMLYTGMLMALHPSENLFFAAHFQEPNEP